MSFFFLLALASRASCAFAADLDVDPGPIVEEAQSPSSLVVRSLDGNTRTVQAGQTLEVGDEFQTGASQSVRLLFEEGAEVLVGSRSWVRISPKDPVDSAPGVELPNGELRAVAQPVPAPGAEKRPIRFLVHTKTATMGVRGTDFVVQSTEDSAALHTLEGKVDAASSVDALREGEVTHVESGFFSHMKKGQGIELPQTFRMSEFLNEFHSRHPLLAQMREKVREDFRLGVIRQRFKKLREVRALLRRKAGEWRQRRKDRRKKR